MKKKIKAFTLIELLIVISIISITSFGVISGFFRFIEKKETDSKLTSLNNYIEFLDQRIYNKEIFDYEINFGSGNLNNTYIVYLNIFDTKQNQTLDYSDNPGKLTLNGSTGEAWNIKIYKENKLSFNENKTTPYSIVFDKGYNYRIKGTLSGTLKKINLNEIELNKIDKENNLNITKITEEKDGVNIGELKITNIGGKKELLNLGNPLSKAYIYFENKGVESFLKLTK